MRTFTLLSLLFLPACGEPTTDERCGDGQDNDGDLLIDCDDDDCSVEDACTDADGDRWTADEDCDDQDPEVQEGWTFYADADGDGFGDVESPTVACEAPSGLVADASDCDDDDPDVFPHADEYCDGVDNDCDGQVDEDDAVDTTTWYLDQDGDGYGASTAADIEACEQPSGFVDDAEDCDDLDTAIDLGCHDYDEDGQTPDEGDCDDEDASVYSGVVSDHQGIEMAYICPGTFSMGSPEDEVGRDDDRETQHEVTLTHPFYIGVYEVTQGDYYDFTGEDPSAFEGSTDLPVETVSWHDAARLANLVSEAAGQEEDDWCYSCDTDSCAVAAYWTTEKSSIYDCPAYRLPTEAEWEFAARAGTTTAFANGGNLVEGTEDDCAGKLGLEDNSFLDNIAWYCGNAENSTQATGTTAFANSWGLEDMHGNVWEWCHDGTESADYSGDETDPFGVASGTWRIYRGGSWSNRPDGVRSSKRGWYDAPGARDNTGLRLARTAD